MTNENETHLTMVQQIAMVVLLAIMAVVDSVITPAVLAIPAVGLLYFAKPPWSIIGLFFFTLPLGYMIMYLFTRESDPAYPIGPAERIVFGTSKVENTESDQR